MVRFIYFFYYYYYYYYYYYWSGLDIDNKSKKKVISFDAKTVVKWSTMPMIDQGPFLGFANN